LSSRKKTPNGESIEGRFLKKEKEKRKEKSAKYLQNKDANGNLALKRISRVLFHQKLQYLCPKEKNFTITDNIHYRTK
jgi:hypothetical protein